MTDDHVSELRFRAGMDRAHAAFESLMGAAGVPVGLDPAEYESAFRRSVESLADRPWDVVWRPNDLAPWERIATAPNRAVAVLIRDRIAAEFPGLVSVGPVLTGGGDE